MQPIVLTAHFGREEYSLTINAGKMQLAVFLDNVGSISSRDIFWAIVGTEPDNIQNNRTITPTAPFLSSASGNISTSTRLIAQVGPGRLDIVFVPIEQGQTALPPSLREQGLVESLIRNSEGIFSALVNARIIRLGLIVDNIIQYNSLDDTNAAFAEVAGISYDLSGSQDLAFQMNRQEKFSDLIVVNKLTKVTANFFRLFAMPSFGSAHVAADTAFALVIEADINTAPETLLQIDGDEFRRLLEWMSERSRQILLGNGNIISRMN